MNQSLSKSSQAKHRRRNEQKSGSRNTQILRHHVLHLHNTIGNHGILQRSLLSNQANLKISSPEDKCEKEAEYVADQADKNADMSRDSCEPLGLWQVTPSSLLDGHGNIASLFSLETSRSNDHSTLSNMESLFSYDFSHVRMHKDNNSAEIANALNARAFTMGRDIFFANGQYAPETKSGQILLAHELTHVVQQDSASIRGQALKLLQCQSKENVNLGIQNIVKLVKEEIDEFLPSYKVVLQALFTAKRIGVLQQLVEILRAYPHAVHGTYFIALLRVIRSRGSEEIFKEVVIFLRTEHITVSEIIEEYPLRFQIADYLSGKIEETKRILISEPEDSLWWVLKATLIETFYMIEEGFVDTLRVGKGSEEAARAYFFETDVVDKWAAVIKFLAEDFLRLTAFLGPLEKAALQHSPKFAARLAKKAEDALRKFSVEVEEAATKAVSPIEKQAAEVAKEAVDDTASKLTAKLTDHAKGAGESAPSLLQDTKKTSLETGALPSAKPTPKVTGMGQLDESAQTWIKGLGDDVWMAINEGIGHYTADAIEAINRFKGVTGFDKVLKDYVIGGWKREGAEFAMRYANKHFKNPKALIFEMESMPKGGGTAGRVVDVFDATDGIRYEFKSVKDVYKYLVKGSKASQFGQLQKDIAFALGKDLERLTKVRWIFDGSKIRKVGLSKQYIVNRLGELLGSTKLLEGYPLLEEIKSHLNVVVEVWP